MNKKPALFLSLLFASLIFSDYILLSSVSKKETAVISRVIDGDTLEINDGRTLRLVNINTPEKSDPLSKKSTEFLKTLENKTVEIEFLEQDKYKRTLARIYTDKYVNLEIIRKGLANKFLVQEGEIDEFADAEADAIKYGRGIWEKSQYYEYIDADVDRKREFVRIKNNNEDLDLSGWTVKDESRKTYKFRDTNLGNLEEIILYSKKGEDNEEEFYWNSASDIWNDNRDSIYIRDSGGKLVFYETYGY